MAAIPAKMQATTEGTVATPAAEVSISRYILHYHPTFRFRMSRALQQANCLISPNIPLVDEVEGDAAAADKGTGTISIIASIVVGIVP